jgi:hypothetical protein
VANDRGSLKTFAVFANIWLFLLEQKDLCDFWGKNMRNGNI